MSMMLGMLEGMLNLTDDEKFKVEQCLPALKAIVDEVDGRLDSIWALDRHFVIEQPTIKRIFDDYRVVGPNLSALLGNGNVDIGATMTAAKDMQAAWQACPSAAQIVALFNRLVPSLNVIIQNWPKAEPAVTIIMAALQRKNMGFAEAIDKMPEHLP